MGTASDMDDEYTPRRASEWLVALTEEPGDADLRARFDVWLSLGPENAADWVEILRTHEVMGMLPPVHKAQWEAFAAGRPAGALPAGPGFGRPSAKRGRPAGLRAGRRMAGVLAAAAIAACLAVIFLPPALLRLRADAVTATAQLRTITLPDGSIAQLGPESAIDISYTAHERRVRLLQGEAFFTVVHNPGLPFSVEAGGVRTTDIGTAFEVRRMQGGTEIAVRDGLVRVDGPALSTQLGAGQWIELGPNGQIARGDADPGEVASWLRGLIIVKDRPTGELVEELRPYYSGIVILRGQGLADRPVTGVFHAADPVSALEAAARSQGARFTRLTPWMIVISPR